MNYTELHKKELHLYNMGESEYESIINKLPSKVFYEYAYHKLSLKDDDDEKLKSLSFDNWNDWKEWNYPVADALRFKYIILDNIEYIEDKNIVDFACHLGYISLFCLHANARFVYLNNIRPHCLDIAEEIINAYSREYKRDVNYKTKLSDIHDIETNREITKGADTVLFLGVLYHVRNHYEILESLVHHSPKNVIIDTLENEHTIKNEFPMVHWVNEDARRDLSGYDKTRLDILSGIPNRKWVEMTMNIFGYDKIKEKVYSCTSQTIRTVSVFQISKEK
jgi:2-polyprenyl-3-methyl-5-hydroxy-6-metoxy-1,4-benzoquinol methylase